MKIQNITKKSYKKIVLGTVGVVVILGLLTGGFLYFHRTKTSVNPSAINSVDYNKPTGDQTANGNNIKQSSATTGKAGDTSDTPPAPTPQKNSDKSIVQISLSSSIQNGQVYQVRTVIDSVVSDGTCDLSLTNGTSTLNYTANVQPQASISTCQGFDIPINSTSLTPGAWNLKLTYNSNTLTGSLTSTINVK